MDVSFGELGRLLDTVKEPPVVEITVARTENLLLAECGFALGERKEPAQETRQEVR